jgi:muconolactone delta-isomerase
MKILALEQQIPNVNQEQMRPYLEEEALCVWDLFQQSVLREIYFRADDRRAVLILEIENGDEAQQILATLPLVREGLITFEVVPLAPHPGFSRLFALQS